MGSDIGDVSESESETSVGRSLVLRCVDFCVVLLLGWEMVWDCDCEGGAACDEPFQYSASIVSRDATTHRTIVLTRANPEVIILLHDKFNGLASLPECFLKSTSILPP